MSEFIKRMIMAEFNRIDGMPAEYFDREYPIFLAAVKRLYPDAGTY